jgi:hypothetical protein
MRPLPHHSDLLTPHRREYETHPLVQLRWAGMPFALAAAVVRQPRPWRSVLPAGVAV